MKIEALNFGAQGAHDGQVWPAMNMLRAKAPSVNQ